MSAEKNIEDNTSKEVLSEKSKTVQGDIYVQDVHKYFGVTKALNGVNFNANFGEIQFMQLLVVMVVAKAL